MLLCHRSPHRRWYPDTWDLPTGQVRDHERPPAALARELASQLDIDIAPQEGVEPFAHVRGVGFRMDIWLVDQWFGNPTQQDPREYDALAWVDVEHAQNLELADPRLLTLIKAVLTTPDDYPGHHPGHQ